MDEYENTELYLETLNRNLIKAMDVPPEYINGELCKDINDVNKKYLISEKQKFADFINELGIHSKDNEINVTHKGNGIFEVLSRKRRALPPKKRHLNIDKARSLSLPFTEIPHRKRSFHALDRLITHIVSFEGKNGKEPYFRYVGNRGKCCSHFTI